MSDTFASDRAKWLEQVCRDLLVPPLAFRQAFVLSRYFSRKTGTAWPSQSTLAAAVGTTERTVRKLSELLVARGHLAVTVQRGRTHSNHYRPVLQNRNETSGFMSGNPEAQIRFSGDENRNFGAGRPEVSRSKTGTVLPPNLYEEPPVPYGTVGGVSCARERAPDGALAFEQFWRHYPKRTGEKKARAEFNRIIQSGEATAADLVRGAMRYAAERDGEEERWTRYPATWLRDGCWNDAPAKPRPPGQRRGQKASLAEEAIRAGDAP